MTLVEAEAFVDALDSDSAHALEVATREFYQAFVNERCCSKSRLSYWTHHLNATRDRLVAILAGAVREERSVGLPRSCGHAHPTPWHDDDGVTYDASGLFVCGSGRSAR